MTPRLATTLPSRSVFSFSPRACTHPLKNVHRHQTIAGLIYLELGELEEAAKVLHSGTTLEMVSLQVQVSESPLLHPRLAPIHPRLRPPRFLLLSFAFFRRVSLLPAPHWQQGSRV
jgi:hypothetical protein